MGTGKDTIYRKHDTFQGQQIKKGLFVFVKIIDQPSISLACDQSTTHNDKKKNAHTHIYIYIAIQSSRAV